ncbi:serine/threonine-protein kinase DCLK1-like isoform X2 [Artemia franciscana]|uniref:serine/threonine-protein kinase DCLK1-like isoform X2 n=1 Tax=Artemia franciscana TaxID=6661 RepID=UPI0032DB2999
MVADTSPVEDQDIVKNNENDDTVTHLPPICSASANGSNTIPRSLKSAVPQSSRRRSGLQHHRYSKSLSGGTAVALPLLDQNSPTNAANRVPLTQISLEKKAKKIKFYRNGDKYFKGVVIAVSQEKYRTFDVLLSELNRAIGDSIHLTQGVRYVFSGEGNRITSIDEFDERQLYVCSSTEIFKKIDYEKCDEPRQFRVRSSRSPSIGLPSCALRREAPLNANYSHVKRKVAELSPDSASSNGVDIVLKNRDFIQPRLITIIKNGNKPRKSVRMLLNKKTAYSFEQVMRDITSAIKPDSGAVRKVFSLAGHQVTSLEDFFQEAMIFVAYGNEKHCLEDFDLTFDELKSVSLYGANNRRAGSAEKSRGVISVQPRGRQLSPSANGNHNGPSPAVRPRSRGRVSQGTPGARSSSTGNILDVADDGFSVPPKVLVYYDVGRTIGDGNFALVRECLDKSSKLKLALKVIDKSRCHGKEVVVESEVAILRRTNHANIVRLYRDFDFPDKLCLVMEYVPGGDLFDAVATAGKFSEPEAAQMLRDLSSALDYLHSNNIVHRDIKPENLLVFEAENGRRSLKLADFGLAREVTGPIYTVCGTPTYVAPEILAEAGYGLKVDIWAAGVILYILLCGYPPFVSPSNNQEELFDAILSGEFEFASPYWDPVSDMARELICLMLQTDPDLRYAASEVLEHPWLNEERPDDIQRQVEMYRGFGVHFGEEY